MGIINYIEIVVIYFLRDQCQTSYYLKMNLAPCKGNVNPHINKSDKDNDITNKVE